MNISPVSYSSYKNTVNIKKNNYLQNKPQVPENQVAFKSLPTNTMINEQSTIKVIGAVLSALGVASMCALGLKTPEDVALDAEIKETFSERDKTISLELKKVMSKYNNGIKKAYRRNPELVKELMLSRVTQEHMCIHNIYETSDLEYSNSAIVLIDKYSQKHPELTSLYKACLSNSYNNNYNYQPEQEKELMDLVTQNPEKAVEMLNKVGYNDSKTYSYKEHYFPSKLLEALKNS